MTTYRIAKDLRHEYVNPDGSTVVVDLKAGDLAPSAEAEAVAVAHLVSAGLAEEVADKPSKKKAESTADVTSEE